MAPPGEESGPQKEVQLVFREGDCEKKLGVWFMFSSETSRAFIVCNPVSERGHTLRVNAKPVYIRFVQIFV